MRRTEKEATAENNKRGGQRGEKEDERMRVLELKRKRLSFKD